MSWRVVAWLLIVLLTGGCGSSLPPVVQRPTPTAPQPTPTPLGAPWTGRYSVTRQGPGEAHTGTLTITHPGAVFEAVWSFDDKNTPGAGLALGPVLAFGSGGRGCGVAVFERVDDRTWRGRRAENGVVITEQWTMVAALDVVNCRYQVDGPAASGSIVIAQRGQVVQVSGRIGGVVEGAGLIRDGVLTAGTGGLGCGVVRYEGNGTMLQGEWTMYGSTDIGVDTASP